MIIQKLEFRETCGSCSEQYNAFKDGWQIHQAQHCSIAEEMLQ